MEFVGQSYVPVTDEHKLTQMIDVKTGAGKESPVAGTVKRQVVPMNYTGDHEFLPVEQSKNRNS